MRHFLTRLRDIYFCGFFKTLVLLGFGISYPISLFLRQYLLVELCAQIGSFRAKCFRYLCNFFGIIYFLLSPPLLTLLFLSDNLTLVRRGNTTVARKRRDTAIRVKPSPHYVTDWRSGCDDIIFKRHYCVIESN